MLATGEAKVGVEAEMVAGETAGVEAAAATTAAAVAAKVVVAVAVAVVEVVVVVVVVVVEVMVVVVAEEADSGFRGWTVISFVPSLFLMWVALLAARDCWTWADSCGGGLRSE